MSFENSKKVLIALDYDDQETALAFVKQLSPDTCRLKVGKEMFTYFGPAFVKELIDLGFDVFLDLKFHDIPNTVAIMAMQRQRFSMNDPSMAYQNRMAANGSRSRFYH